MSVFFLNISLFCSCLLLLCLVLLHMGEGSVVKPHAILHHYGFFMVEEGFFFSYVLLPPFLC